MSQLAANKTTWGLLNTSVRRQALLSGLFFLAIFSIYLQSLSPAFHPDDSAETITAGVTLSIQHPPGYPLHSLLGRLAQLVLPGSPAFGVNLVSAFFAALAVLLLAWCLAAIRREADERAEGPDLAWVDLAAASVAAMGLTLWFQATIAKGGLYSLNMAITLALLLAVLGVCRRFRLGKAAGATLWMAGLLFGLGFANHWTSQVVLLPGLAILLLGPLVVGAIAGADTRSVPTGTVKDIAMVLLLFLCGFSLYLYLPLRAAHNPPLVWGDATSLQGFWWMFNRSQYAGIEAEKTLSAFTWLLGRIAENMKAEYHMAGLVVLAAGWCWLLIRRPVLGLGLLAIPFVLAVAVALKANPPRDAVWIIDPYLVPVHVCAAFGLAGWALFFQQNQGRLALGLLAAACALFAWHKPVCDQSAHYFAWDYIRNINLSSPKNAIVFTEGDSNTAGPFATRHAFHQRMDLAYIASVISDYPWYLRVVRAQYPALSHPPAPQGVSGNLAWWAVKNPDHPVVFTNSYTKSWVDEKMLKPRGLVNLLDLKNRGPWPVKVLNQNRVHPAYATRGVFTKMPRDPITDRLVTDNYVESRARLAQAYMDVKKWKRAEAEFVSLSDDKKGWDAALVQAGNAAIFDQRLEDAGRHWKKAQELNPASPEALVNVGLYHFKKAEWGLAALFARKALGIQPDMANAKEILEKAEQQQQIGNSKPQTPAPLPRPGYSEAAQADKLAMAGSNEPALALYRKALKLGFENVNIYRNIAVMEGKQGRTTEAMEAIERAIALDQNQAELFKLKGILLSNIGRQEEALGQLKKALEMAPGDSSISAIIQKLEGVKP